MKNPLHFTDNSIIISTFAALGIVCSASIFMAQEGNHAMRPNKPLYPPPWWNDCPPKPDCDFLTPGDEIVLCFVGYDSNGNPLFSLKRPRPKCNPHPDICPPKRCFYQ